MKEHILSQVYQNPAFKSDELEKIFDAHDVLEFKKGDYILKEGQTAHDYMILVKGLMRSFVYDYNGDDVTTKVLPTGI